MEVLLKNGNWIVFSLLLCSDSVAMSKECNIKQHYETKHTQIIKKVQEQTWKDQWKELEKSLK